MGWVRVISNHAKKRKVLKYKQNGIQKNKKLIIIMTSVLLGLLLTVYLLYKPYTPIINYFPYINGSVFFLGGVYLFLLTFRVYEPKYKTIETALRADNLFKSWGKKAKFGSIFLMLFGAYNLIWHDPNMYRLNSTIKDNKWTEKDKAVMIKLCMKGAAIASKKYPQITLDYCTCAIDKIVHVIGRKEYIEKSSDEQYKIDSPYIKSCETILVVKSTAQKGSKITNCILSLCLFFTNMAPEKIKLYQIVSLLTTLITIASCNKPEKGWKTIELGRYLLSVPASFNYKYQRGIDSEGGEITNDTITFFTDYGYYTDTLFQTPQEYLDKHYFVSDAQSKFEKPGIEYDKNNSPKVEVLSIRPATKLDSDNIGFFSGADYIAVCSHEGKLFNWPIKMPADIKNHLIKRDTLNNIHRKTVLPKKGYVGETAIYMCRKEDFIKDRQSYYAIVIGAHSLTEKQQSLAQKIFLTLKPKT